MGTQFCFIVIKLEVWVYHTALSVLEERGGGCSAQAQLLNVMDFLDIQPTWFEYAINVNYTC